MSIYMCVSIYIYACMYIHTYVCISFQRVLMRQPMPI